MPTETELAKIHARSIRNKRELEQAEVIGCFYCLARLSPEQVTEFCTERRGTFGETGLCPYCGIDSLIPFGKDDIIVAEDGGRYYAHSPELLKILHEMYFSRSLTQEEYDARFSHAK